MAMEKSHILMVALMKVTLKMARRRDKAHTRGAKVTKTKQDAHTEDSGPKISRLVKAPSPGLMAQILKADSKTVTTRRVPSEVATGLSRPNSTKQEIACPFVNHRDKNDRNLHLLTSSSTSSTT
mgnify:FL=1